MGMQEFLVTKRRTKLQEFMDVFGKNVTCVAIPKENIKFPLSKIKKGEHLVVLYGERSLLSADLKKFFPKERVLISENANHMLFGTYFPEREEVKKKFDHIEPEKYKE